MIAGIYSAATGMDLAAQRHELIAQNLAHINMPGYRRVSLQQTTFESALSDIRDSRSGPEMLGTVSTGPLFDFSPGHIERTGQPLDLAIQGNGFFVVETPNELLYTRNGTFHVNETGKLVTAEGHSVVSERGNLTLPPDTSVSQLEITSDGTVTAGGTPIGKIKVVQFSDPQALVSRGTTLFSAPASISPEDSDASVLQGHREHANVQAVHELVGLIAASRAHDAAQKAMRTISGAIENHTNLRG